MIRSSEVRDAIRLVAKARKEARKARPKITVARDGKQREPRIHDKVFLAWIRRQPCTLSEVMGGWWCDGKVEAAHIRYGLPGEPPTGLQRKPNDQRVTPLCAKHHREQHSENERMWWASHGINPHTLAAQLYAQFMEQT